MAILSASPNPSPSLSMSSQAARGFGYNPSHVRPANCTGWLQTVNQSQESGESQHVTRMDIGGTEPTKADVNKPPPLHRMNTAQDRTSRNLASVTQYPQPGAQAQGNKPPRFTAQFPSHLHKVTSVRCPAPARDIYSISTNAGDMPQYFHNNDKTVAPLPAIVEDNIPSRDHSKFHAGEKPLVSIAGSSPVGQKYNNGDSILSVASNLKGMSVDQTFIEDSHGSEAVDICSLSEVVTSSTQNITSPDSNAATNSSTPTLTKAFLAESMDDFMNGRKVAPFNPNIYGKPSPTPRNTHMNKVSQLAHGDAPPEQTVSMTKNTSVPNDLLRKSPSPDSVNPSCPPTVCGQNRDLKTVHGNFESTQRSMSVISTSGKHSLTRKYPDLKSPRAIHTAIWRDISPSKPTVLQTPNVAQLPQCTIVMKIRSAHGADSSLDVNDSVSGSSQKLSQAQDDIPQSQTDLDCRANIGYSNIGLYNWDGTWAPAPASWENDRDAFSNEFIPRYINVWNEQTPAFSSVDLGNDKFSQAWPIDTSDSTMIAAPDHGLCLPSIDNSGTSDKQRTQSADISSKLRMAKIIKLDRMKKRHLKVEREHYQAALHALPESDPNTPTIQIYLRPATEDDAAGINAIYNHYVQNSIIPEDQIPINEDDMRHVIGRIRQESLPFIVAIKGPVPKSSTNVRNELVVGYSCADTYLGLNGNPTRGLHRFSATIHVYVEPHYLRKGIGRALLDRLLQVTCATHTGKDGYDWIIQKKEDQDTYTIGGMNGIRRYHQLIIERPIEIKDDQDHVWLRRWLESKFYFRQVALLQSIARSTTAGGSARWLDVAVFQIQACSPLDVDHFL